MSRLNPCMNEGSHAVAGFVGFFQYGDSRTGVYTVFL